MIKVLLFLLWMTSFGNLFGEIKNGYEDRLQGYKTSLHKLQLKLLENQRLSLRQIHKIKSEIKDLISSISYYELTSSLINQLRVVSPDIYNAIDNIRDRKGRPTRVFVRLIPREQSRIPLVAATFFSQSRMDRDVCVSEYGQYSVSIEIWLSERALFLLCHELGHISYVVPNLASYCTFYEKNYRAKMGQLTFIGHQRQDLSGKSALRFQRKFLQDTEDFFKVVGEKPESAIAMMQEIRKKNKRLERGLPSQYIEYIVRSGSSNDHRLYSSKACATFNSFELALKAYEKSITRSE